MPDLDGKIADTGQCREKTNQPQSEDDRLVIRGEDPRLRREIRGLFYPPAIPLLTSGVLPGNVHDLTARENVLAAIPIKGAGHGVRVPVKKPAWVKELDIDTRAANALLRSARYPGKRATGVHGDLLSGDCAVTGNSGWPPRIRIRRAEAELMRLGQAGLCQPGARWPERRWRL